MASHQHKKRFGQNFLNNDRIIHQIVAAIAPKPDQHLVEIGPGEAVLTRPLLESVAKLDIIEIDNDLIAPLTQKLSHFPAFHLHHTDALSFDYAGLRANNHSPLLRIVGNLPYNISSPLLFHLIDYAEAIEDMHFMLQKEVVKRITSQPGFKTYGRLSVMLQYACEVENLFMVGPENFDPPPKVDSAIIRLRPYKQKPFQADDEAAFGDLVRQAFSQKRKTLRNNLKGWLTLSQIEQCQLNPSARAETLSVKDFVTLANAYTHLGQ
ncbi:MAG: 16S rRNA (adenine(1518)-N(6)/adenine(1519)-N(6))-dimethyltransferase [Piscirickettsiaceae bacterium CG_4_10_14_3_um_filter_44_349]|nr:16S rRNA (adenine(1518)-N(6)/adenine(1519)-N(6))-dimethyltransferase RsmA [Thiomicrospira sp.]OIP94023.1 MAG: 16S rRNA (adenine(1518)-N(6)/adenine(1519)-N(6))-dimethyltransferase [Thiomicrospira sp. CG2_30_44_34]PIX80806.1 MAG: 16S rRNA (adenine(1518)-N(6)/adenine(1519)-N(6))-dimethyltransferase [Piscirickettsiaceae bacterium CG_4_10_14_3_um_filter_44_349]NCN67389.1 16S rRNA (adenine(1518)-N(6)/adenine(1519)-N(6))-dimethyltransferase RsmA [Thiomicrospira sp.]NCO13341.1 16S rRNA (adenine(1518